MTEASIAASQTSPSNHVAGKICVIGRLITEEEGWQIVNAAASWEGTPYDSVGANSVKGVKGDCSGTTQKIYTEAGFPYPYKQTSTFAAYVAASSRFQEITDIPNGLQAGDVLLWPGHMAIYAPFPKDHPKRQTGVMRRGQRMDNNFYTAFNDRTHVPYGPYNIATFRNDRFKAFRYLLLPGEGKC